MSFADMLLLSFPRGGSSIGRDESEAGNCGGLWSWRNGSRYDRDRRSEGEGCKSCHWPESEKCIGKERFSGGYDVGLYDEDSNNKKVQDMQKRIFLIQEVKPVLTVSIHQNSYEDPGVKGPQVFYYRDSVKGEELAEIIQEKMNDYLEVERPRQAKGNTTYYLLKRSPGILNIVECGFLTNPEEAGKLLQDDYQEKVAAAVADGVEEYIKNNEQ